MNKTDISIGTKVRMVQTDSTGVITGEITTSSLDGGSRVPVKWDNTGMTNEWNPIWLRTAESNPNDDPHTVRDGILVRTKRQVENRSNGLFVISGGGFSKLSDEEMKGEIQ